MVPGPRPRYTLGQLAWRGAVDGSHVPRGVANGAGVVGHRAGIWDRCDVDVQDPTPVIAGHTLPHTRS